MSVIKSKKNSEEQERGISLSQYIDSIGKIIEKNFYTGEWVRCEVIALNQSRGHYYFELADTNEFNKRIKSQTAILYSSKATAILNKFQKSTGQKITGGMKLLVYLKPNLKAQFGFSFILEDVDPNFTIGEMEAKANAIRQSMFDKNIANMNKTLLAPKHFTNVAVISPSSAAGLGDFKVEADLLEKNGLCNFDYFEAIFEGEKTESTIVQAFTNVHNAGFSNYDCLVFIRGGGAKSSLQFLNEEKIVKCVCRVPIPVFVGVGHEKDKVLVDEFANSSFDTPSKVIEHISSVIFSNYLKAEENISFIEQLLNQNLDQYEKNVKLNFQTISSSIDMALENYSNKIEQSTNYIMNSVYEYLTYVENKILSNKDIMAKDLLMELERYESKVENYDNAIKKSVEVSLQHYDNAINGTMNIIYLELLKLLELKESELKLIMAEINESHPYKVLNKGYSIIKNEKNVIDSIKSLENLKTITVILKDGEKEININ